MEYMAAIFRKLADSDETAMQLALEFYEPMYLLYSVYDGAEDKESIAPLLDTHIPVLSRQRQRAFWTVFPALTKIRRAILSVRRTRKLLKNLKPHSPKRKS